jgi:hypothetical protein
MTRTFLAVGLCCGALGAGPAVPSASRPALDGNTAVRPTPVLGIEGEEPIDPPPSDAVDPSDDRIARLGSAIDKTLAHYHRSWRLNTRDHNPWEVMHAIVAFGTDTELAYGRPDGQIASAIGWLCWDRECNGQSILDLVGGQPAAQRGPGVQGHPGQFLAILAQSKVRKDYEIRSSGRTLTVADLIEAEKAECRESTELTFKLISFAYYLDSDEEWTTRDGKKWSIPKLIREEISAPILRTAPCGGTHRLMGLSYAVSRRVKQGKPIDGQFLRAETYVKDFHEHTFRLQNPDGSMSTQWFEYRSNRPDLDRKLQTSGHILEWLAYSLSDEDLTSDRMLRGIEFLTNALWENRSRNWSIGPLGHGLHALTIYRERKFPDARLPERVETAIAPPGSEQAGEERAEAGESD